MQLFQSGQWSENPSRKGGEIVVRQLDRLELLSDVEGPGMDGAQVALSQTET